jgi:transposase
MRTHWLRPIDVAAMCGVSVRTVRGWIRERRVRVIRLSSKKKSRPRYLVSQDSLRLYLQKGDADV